MMYIQKRNSNQHGFTIIELIIATTVFSVVLLLCSYSLLQIGKTYYHGITSSRTQNTARAISDELVQNIQFGGSDANILLTGQGLPGTTTPWSVCINNKSYSALLYQKLVTSPQNHVLVAGQPCGPTSSALSSPYTLVSGERELMSENSVLQNLSIQMISSNVYSVKVRVASGDKDLFEHDQYFYSGSPTNCKSGPGNQYCSVSELETIARIRVK